MAPCLVLAGPKRLRFGHNQDFGWLSSYPMYCLHFSLARAAFFMADGNYLSNTPAERWSRFLTQSAKVDSPMKRKIRHENAETVVG